VTCTFSFTSSTFSNGIMGTAVQRGFRSRWAARRRPGDAQAGAASSGCSKGADWPTIRISARHTAATSHLGAMVIITQTGTCVGRVWAA
jgi:hypothetical protein